ncbi:HK97 gp10 family phage protein [Fuchsiella alkaliacetigena]|uniref:HK97 gp10 family phage protein n=1 Tax=Fuchsiella alkaliacetigena TaxID=957042 RepID=UPI00200AC922|nr:HK97 gp10 family phage protein [Fuchsiella alkaliacetigena]MCK8824730.1 HK97 gp10 family phage protein [Fuchsiella alkaliacetigena]
MVQDELIAFEWEGLDEQIRELKIVEHEIEDELDRILLQCAEIYQSEVQKLIKQDKWHHKTPDKHGKYVRDLIDTGYMRKAITSYVARDLNHRYGVTIFPAEYTKYLNYGTEDEHGNELIQAYKFVEKAKKNVEDEIYDYFEEKIIEVLG